MKLPKNRIIVIGEGKECKKCNKLMERRKHFEKPKDKSYFFTEWDFCKNCKHVQHYEEFKSNVWAEDETRDNFFKNII